MQSFYRDLLRHSAVYGLSQVLSRLASFLLLPIYTSYLRPADYGVIAILDLVSGIFAIMIGAGMGAAVTRYYFEAQDEKGRSQVWWTGLTFVLFTGTAFLFPMMFYRDALADVTLGNNIKEGAFFYTLILLNMWLNIVGKVLDTYLRVRKWSGTSVCVNLFRLVLNMGLNIFFLAAWDLGVTGILVGNLITGGVGTLILVVIFLKNQESYSFDFILLGKLWRFGGPLILVSLLSSLMHQVDRYLLRLFLDMDQVGVYSVAYTIGQGVNTLFLLPFHMIWSVLMFEVAKQPNAKQIYVQVFQYFVYALALVMLGVSLVAKDLFALMVAPEYIEGAALIPIVCLAYLLFSLHSHFQVPVLLAKRTVTLLPVVSVAVLTNLAANFLLIPSFGSVGAAWASVITFATYSFVGLWRYRRIDRYNYPLLYCGAVLVGMAGSYVAYDWLIYFPGETSKTLPVAMLIWLIWFVILFWGPIRKFIETGTRFRVKMPLSLQERL